MASGLVRIPKTRKYGGKVYRLVRAFVDKETAERLRRKYKADGYSVRVYELGGAVHFYDRYHVYVRKGR